MSRRVGVITVCFAVSCLTGSGHAALFTAGIDEFWVVRNGVEAFRDSFGDGLVPPSGPQDGLGGNPDTYTLFGTAGMTGEAAGKLTMTPSLGDATLISGAFSDLATQATKLRTVLPGTPNSLELADSFEIHGLFDLSSLPSVVGQFFGIRATDRAVSDGNEGNDTVQLALGRNQTTGDLGVALHELDFAADSIDRIDFLSLEGALGGADQIELIISKGAGTPEIGAAFNLYGAGALLFSHAMDTFSAAKGANLAIYDGETYTRAAFISGDRIITAAAPEPAGLGLLSLALAGLGVMRRRKA